MHIKLDLTRWLFARKASVITIKTKAIHTYTNNTLSLSPYCTSELSPFLFNKKIPPPHNPSQSFTLHTETLHPFTTPSGGAPDAAPPSLLCPAHNNTTTGFLAPLSPLLLPPLSPLSPLLNTVVRTCPYRRRRGRRQEVAVRPMP